MKAKLVFLLVFAICLVRGLFGQDDRPGETRTFGYSEDQVETPDAIQAMVFQPNPDTDQAFLLYLESSMDLESWTIEGLQDYQLNADGTIIATGEDAIDRKFWRLRIVHPNAQSEEEWLAVIRVNRTETDVTAMLEIRTNYYPFVENYVQYSIDVLPVEWDPTLENLEAVNTATQNALMRLLEIVQTVQPADGDYFEATRPIE